MQALLFANTCVVFCCLIGLCRAHSNAPTAPQCILKEGKLARKQLCTF